MQLALALGLKDELFDAHVHGAAAGARPVDALAFLHAQQGAADRRQHGNLLVGIAQLGGVDQGLGVLVSVDGESHRRIHGHDVGRHGGRFGEIAPTQLGLELAHSGKGVGREVVEQLLEPMEIHR